MGKKIKLYSTHYYLSSFNNYYAFGISENYCDELLIIIKVINYYGYGNFRKKNQKLY